MIKAYDPSAKSIGRKALKKDIFSLNDKIREFHIKTTEGAVICVTLDHWTPKNGSETYVGMTASWITKNWEKKTCILGMCLHTGNTKAEDIMDKFLEDLTKFVQSNSSIFACTSDTTGNMNKFGTLLEESNIWHLYCTDHIIHLSCSLLYKKTNGRGSIADAVPECIIKARKLVMHYKKSTQAATKLKDVQKFLNVEEGEYIEPDYIALNEIAISQTEEANTSESTSTNENAESVSAEEDDDNDQDHVTAIDEMDDSCVIVPTPLKKRGPPLTMYQDTKTRWWSTQKMNKRLVKIKMPIKHCSEKEMFGGQNEYYVECDYYLSDEEWEILEATTRVLDCFEKSMKLLEGEKYVTAPWVPVQIKYIHDRLEQGRNAV